MISLSENKVALVNLKVTINAIEELDKLIENYSVDLPGPAYVAFEYTDLDAGAPRVQFERSIMVTALKAQKQRLVDYLAGLGIDANS